MKKAFYYEEAKRMYCIDGLSLDAIAKLLKDSVTRRTLFNWKTENSWDVQRKQHLDSAKSMQEDLLEIARTQIAETKANPSASNIFALVKVIGAIKQFKSIDLEPEQIDDAKEKKFSEDTIALIKKEILGL